MDLVSDSSEKEETGKDSWGSAEMVPSPLDDIRSSIAEISESMARFERDLDASLASPISELQADLGKLFKHLGLESRRRMQRAETKAQGFDNRRGGARSRDGERTIRRNSKEARRSPRLETKEVGRLQHLGSKSRAECESNRVQPQSEESGLGCQSDLILVRSDSKEASPSSRPRRRSSSIVLQPSVDREFSSEIEGPFAESTWAAKGVEMPDVYKFWPMGVEPRRVPELTTNIYRESVSEALSKVSSTAKSPADHTKTSYTKCTIPFDPTSKVVLSVDVLGIIFFLYELCVIPVTLAWDLHEDWIYVGEWACVTFWFFDLAFGFLVGFFRRGELVMNPLSIAIHYLKGGKFLVSLVLVSNDLFILLMDMHDNDVSAMRALHIVKISKIAKLARLLKLSQVVQHLNDALGWQRSPATKICDKLFGTFLLLMVYSHVICCVWYFVGTSDSSDTGQNWLSSSGREDPSVLNEYVMAFEFVVSQMALGQAEVHAVNSLELVVQCCLLFTGLCFTTILISYFSAELSDLMMSMRGSTQTSLGMQFYCVANKVPNALAVRALSQIKERLAMKLQLSDDEKDVSAFALLTSPLRNEIMRSIQTPHLVTHSLFHIWYQLDSNTLGQLCVVAVSFTTMVPTDELFTCFDECSMAYHLVRGQLVYCQSPLDSLVNESISTPVREGTWFCEAALWSLWRHVGRMEAEAYSKVLHIDANALMGVVLKHPLIHSVTAEYARDFHKRLISAVPPLAPFPTDVVVPFTDSSELLASHVSTVQLEQAIQQGKVSMKDPEKEKLRRQIASGQCAIRRTHDNELTRVVMLSVVQLQRRDGRVYMEVGVVHDSGSVSGELRLPGTKRAIGELPQVALERVVSEHFPPFRSTIETESMDQEVDIKLSPHYGMPTTYFRAVHYAKWKGNGEVALRRADLLPMEEDELAWLPTKQLRKREVYVFPGQPRGMVLYAWLSREEVTFLMSEGHAQHWVSSLDFLPWCAQQASPPRFCLI